MKRKPSNLFLVAAATLVAASFTHAADITWDNAATAGIQGGAGVWDTSTTNWTIDAGVNRAAWNNTTNAADTAVFGTAGGVVTVGTAGAPGGAISLGGLNFTFAGYTVGNVAGNGTLAFGNATGAINTSTLTTAGITIINSNLTGTGGLTLAANGDLSASGGGATGRLQLSGDNSGLSGGIAITGGLVDAGTNNAFGSNLITLTNGGGILDASHNVTLGNAIVVGSGGGTIRVFSSTTTTLAGTISGSGNLNRTDGGTLNLTGDLSGYAGTFDNQGTSAVTVVNGTTAAAGNWKVTAGTLRLGTNGLASGGTLTLNGGTLSSNAAAGAGDRTIANALSIGGNITLGDGTNSGALNFTNTAAVDLGAVTRTLTVNSGVTLAAALTNGSLTKAGTGTLTLSGASTYTGATAINAGTLNLTGSLTSAVTVGTAALTGTGSTTGLLTMNAGSTIALAGGAATTSVTANGVNFAGATNVTFNAPIINGTTYDVVTYGGGPLSNFSNLSAAAANYRGGFTDTGSKITLVANVGTRTWSATAGGTWALNAGTNFTEGDQKFFSGDSVIFGETAADQVVTLTGNLAPASLLVSNQSNKYTFSGGGAIVGLGALTKSGSGTLVLANTTANTYTGGTSVTGGVLQIGDGTNNGSISNTGPVSIAAGGTLRFEQNGTSGPTAVPWANISGAGALQFKAGSTGSGGARQWTAALGTAFTGTLQVEAGRVANAGTPGTGAASFGNTSQFVIKNGGHLGVWLGGTFGVGQSFFIEGTGYGETSYASALRLGDSGTATTINGTITLTGNATISASNGSTNTAISTFAGSIGESAVGSTLSFGAVGGAGTSGIYLLTAANTYTGATTVNSGRLQFAKQVSLYNNIQTSWTTTNLTVATGATAAFNVGGTGEFTEADIHKLQGLSNVASGTTATTGFKTGSFIGLDTTNAGGSFTHGLVIANHVAGATTDTLGLVKLGTGNLLLTAANTFSGGTSILGGTLTLGNTNALQNSTLNHANAAGALVFDSSVSSFTLGGLTGNQGIALQNNAGTPAAITLSAGNNNTATTYSGVLSGAGSFAKVGNAQLTLTGLNTYTGVTTIKGSNTTTPTTGQSVTVSSIGNGGVAGNLGAATNAASNLIFGQSGQTAGQLNYVGGGESTDRLFTVNGNAVIMNNGSGALNFANTGTIAHTGPNGHSLTLAGSNGGTFASAIADGASAIGLVKTGTGSWTLSGNNSYTGGTTVSGGYLSFANTTALPATGAISVTGTGSLVATGPQTTVQGWLDSGRVTAASTGNIALTGNSSANINFATGGFNSLGLSSTGAATYRGIITVGTGGYLFGGEAATNLTVASNLTGAATNLTKNGAGTVTLTGSNSYTGNTLVSGGTLQIGSSSINATGGSVTIGAGALATRSINAIGTVGSTITLNNGSGALIFGGSADETTDRVINQTVGSTVTHNGKGTLTFSSDFTAANVALGVTFNGGGSTVINGISRTSDTTALNFTKNGVGTLTVNGNLAGAAASTIRAQGGVLVLNGASTNARAITGNRAIGGVIQFGASSAIKTTEIGTNNLLGGWATFGGTDWASGSGTQVVAFNGTYTADTWAANNNTNVTLAGANPASGATTNSLRFNATGAKTLTLAGTNLLTSGGLLITAAVGANTTTVTGGTLTAGAANATTDLIVHQFNTAGGLTIASAIANNGTGVTSLTKAGAGTLTFLTQKTYTGGTNILAGTLDLTGGGGASGTIRGTVNVAAGATLRLSTGDATGYNTDATRLGVINLLGGTLNVNTASNQTLGSAVVNMTGGSITGIASSNLDFFGGTSALNTLASGTTSTISGITVSALRQGNTTFTIAPGYTTSGIDLDIQSVIKTSASGDATTGVLTITGGGTVAFSGNNTITGSATKFLTVAGGSTLMIGNGGTTGNISTNAAFGVTNNATLAFNRSDAALSIANIISGTGEVRQIGSGMTTLTGNNSYSGGTTVTAGTLTAGNASALGSGAVTVNGGTLALGSFNVTPATITLNGGTLTGSAYTGTVNVGANAVVSGTFGTLNTGTDPSRSINTTGGLNVTTLTGQGTFAGGLVTVSGSHNPGNSPGTQNFTDLAYGDGATLNLEIAANGLSADLIVVSNTLTLGNNLGLNLTLFGSADYTSTFWDSDHSYDLLTFTTLNGTINSANLSGLNADPAQGNWSFGQDSNSFNATWTPVPEPSVALLGGLSLLGLLRRRRA